MTFIIKVLGVGLIVSIVSVAIFWLIAKKLLSKSNVTNVTIATGTTWTEYRP